MLRVITAFVVCLLLTASGCAADDPAISTTVLDLPQDVSTAGFDIAPAYIDDAIPRSEAIEIAHREYGERYEGSERTAYLVELTIPDTTEGDPSIHDLPVWLIRYSGLDIPVAGPVSPNPTSAEAITVGHAYVVLDARSGAWLLTKETR